MAHGYMPTSFKLPPRAPQSTLFFTYFRQYSGIFGCIRQGRCHELEGWRGRGSMHWKVEGQYCKKTNNLIKVGGAWPPCSYGGAAPGIRYIQRNSPFSATSNLWKNFLYGNRLNSIRDKHAYILISPKLAIICWNNMNQSNCGFKKKGIYWDFL